MRIRKILIGVFVLAGTLAAIPPAIAGDSLGPACTDIVDASVQETTHRMPLVDSAPLNQVAVPRSTPNVEGYIGLAAPADCGARYAINVMDPTGTVLVARGYGDSSGAWTDSSGRGVVPFIVPVTAPLPQVCVYLEVLEGATVDDRAPNADEGQCVVMTLDAGPPAFSFH